MKHAEGGLGRVRRLAGALLAVGALASAVAPIALAQTDPSTPALTVQPIPPPQPITLDPSTTALLVIDLSTRCDDPAQTCSQLVPILAPLVQRARDNQVFIMYTVSAS